MLATLASKGFKSFDRLSQYPDIKFPFTTYPLLKKKKKNLILVKFYDTQNFDGWIRLIILSAFTSFDNPIKPSSALSPKLFRNNYLWVNHIPPVLLLLWINASRNNLQ